MELKNGKLRVQAGFSLKVGLPNYSSKDRSAGISLEWDLDEGADLEAVLDEALALEARLDTDLKLVVATALGVSTEEVDGTLQPVLPDQAPAPTKTSTYSKPKASSGGRSSGGSRSSGGRGSFTDEVYTVEIDGEGTFQVKDQRELIRSGKFSEKSPAFKLLDGEINGSDGVWRNLKGGGINPVYSQIAEQIEAA